MELGAILEESVTRLLFYFLFLSNAMFRLPHLISFRFSRLSLNIFANRVNTYWIPSYFEERIYAKNGVVPRILLLASMHALYLVAVFYFSNLVFENWNCIL